MIPNDTASLPVLAAYHRGRRFLEKRRMAAVPGNGPMVMSTEITLLKDPVSRKLYDRLANELGMGRAELRADAQLAEAVELIIRNCGSRAFGVLFDEERPQTRKAIMELSRTADTRQRYRIVQVQQGKSRSVAPQNDDPIYDTVAFKEVSSRLARARGSLTKLQNVLNRRVDHRVAEECKRLLKICLAGARLLRKLVAGSKQTSNRLPRRLSREAVWPILYSRSVRGRIVGRARQALHLILKNVWDFAEMQRRGLIAKKDELRKTLDELTIIESTTKQILADNLK